MQPIREDEDDVLARLEARLETVVSVLSRMKDRNAELEARLSEALSAREALEADLAVVRGDAERLRNEADGLRSRQKQAAARIKTLLTQVEQMDLMTEG